jgi:amidase
MPIGVQIVARPWREDVALAVAGAVEKEFGGWRKPPDMVVR